MEQNSNLISVRRKDGGLALVNYCHGCKENIQDWALLSQRHSMKSRRLFRITDTNRFFKWIFCLVWSLCICINNVSADTTEAPSEENKKVDDEPPTIPKAVVTVAGMVVFVLLGISISKLVDYCYDRHAISDDASDISDYTKELLKAQLMLAFSKGTKDKKEKLTPDDMAKKFVKVWRAKVSRNKARRLKREREMAEARGTYRPGSSRTRSAKTRVPATMNVISEKTRPGSSKKKTSISTISGADDRKGASRPISAGLKSRPVSAKSFKFIPRAGKR